MRLSLWKLFRSLLLALGTMALLMALAFVMANVWVLASTRERIEHNLAKCARERVGIVFGTSHWTRSGLRNPHFEGRMTAAAELVASGRVDHLLVSGDNSTRYYNEPVTMWRDLRGRGVRDQDMTLDYAGFSTFDTLARARDVFQVDRALLVTQGWHLPRALFIADALGLDTVGCAAPEREAEGTWYLRMREWVARVATLGDLYLWNREPRFLGPLEPLQIAPRGAPALGDIVAPVPGGTLSDDSEPGDESQTIRFPDGAKRSDPPSEEGADPHQSVPAPAVEQGTRAAEPRRQDSSAEIPPREDSGSVAAEHDAEQGVIPPSPETSTHESGDGQAPASKESQEPARPSR
ncbi:ElyC/SanA/YdcF family protein [Halomonas sp. V046]|uniref:ElyC/SanA/YdcF family protein n=1 Tax=Halomonas sp. V046 TaxID=3459611 RepID=UPI004043F67F